MIPPDTIERPEAAAEYSISELARDFRTTARTLRFYEDKGLLHPRRVGLQRIYSRRDRSRLKLILLGKKVGLSLEDIAGMLDVYQLPDSEPEQLKVALESMNDHLEFLRQRQNDIELILRELNNSVDVLSAKLEDPS